MSRIAPTLTIKPEALPASVRELARVLGDNDALRLLGAFGGARLPGLMRMKEDHPFRVFLGEESFGKLVAHYGSETPDLPKCDGYLRELRHELVRQCRAQGMTIDETAEETGYTRRHVINIMGGEGAAADTFTRDMFADDDEDLVVSVAGSANDPFGLGAARKSEG
jgi:hypothetical protein